jgi:hypothetical protein
VPYCTNCGEEITDEQRYCSYCGEPVGGRRRERAEQRPETHDHTAEQPFEGDPPPEGYEDPPGVGTPRQRSGTPGTLDLFGTSVRAALGLPLLLVALAVAWFAFFMFDMTTTALQVPGIILSGLVGLFVAGIIYVATEDNREGDSSSLGERAGQVAGSFLPLAAIWAVFVPAFLFGLLLLLLPGLYIAGRLFLAFPACVLDGKSPLESLSTSWDLTSDISLKPFGLLLLSFVSALVLSVLFSVVALSLLLAGGADLPVDAGAAPSEAADELANQPEFLIATALSQALALAVIVGAIQVAAARLYLALQYGETDPAPP